MAYQTYKSIDGLWQYADVSFDSISVTKISIGSINFADSKENIRVDSSAGESLTSGFENTFVGKYAGQYALTSQDGVAIGHSAGRLLSTGVRNVLVGAQAGMNLQGESDNVLMGHRAGLSLEGKASENVVIGNEATSEGKTGSRNVTIGYQAGSNVTGSDNVLVGHQVAVVSTDISSNVILGSGAAPDLKMGQNNVILGNGDTFQQGSNNVIIQESKLPPAMDNQLRIGGLIEGDMVAKTLVLKGDSKIMGGFAVEGDSKITGGLAIDGQDTMIRKSSGVQTIPIGVWTVFTSWNQQVFQKGAITYNTGNCVIQRSGVYVVHYTVEFVADGNGSRGARIEINGVTQQESRAAALVDGSNTTVSGAATLYATNGQLLRVLVFQNAPGPLDCFGTHLSVTLLH